MGASGGSRGEAVGPGASLAAVREPLGVLAAVIGILASLYVIGWIVSSVALAAARLPGDIASTVLSDRQVFGTGLRATALTAGAFAFACAAAYLTSWRRWDVNGQAWHYIVARGGVGKARGADEVQRERAERAEAGRVVRLERMAKVELATPGLHARAAGHRRSAADLDRAHRHLQLRERAPLGDGAVRIIAGFNILILSVLAAVAAARFIELIYSSWWTIVIAALVGFFVVHWALTRWDPLTWGPHLHGAVWLLVAVAALFASAPIGVLVLTGIAISTLGRTLARKIQAPSTLSRFLRSPLPWLLLVIFALIALAYYAIPPVSFPGAVVTTASGEKIGGLLARNSSGVYLATCTPLADATSTAERVEFIRSEDAGSISVGGRRASFDSGERPSLVSLALRALGLGGHPPTLFNADLRPRQGTCAGAPPPSLTGAAPDPALGGGVIIGPPPPGGIAHDGEPPIQNGKTPPVIATLARRYQPTLLLTVADRNWPVSVGAVMKDIGSTGGRSCLVSASTPNCATATTVKSLMAGTSRSADYLRFPARLTNDPTDQFQAFERGQYIAPGSPHHWLADPGLLDPWYTAQVYFYDGGRISTAQWPKAARDPNVPGKLIGFEYWFFYPFNYYPTTVGTGLMNDAPLAGDGVNTDLHQGDWEHVVVLLDPATYKPMWLYMARHADEGKFYPWDSPALQFDGDHPIIQAAFGGHPSYDSGCGGRPRAKLNNLSDDWVVCGSGRFAFRASTTPLVDLAQQRWSCWKGHFGEAKPGLEVNAPGEADDVVVKAREFTFVAGPPSPLLQAENTGACTGNGPAGNERGDAGRLAALHLPGATP